MSDDFSRPVSMPAWKTCLSLDNHQRKQEEGFELPETCGLRFHRVPFKHSDWWEVQPVLVDCFKKDCFAGTAWLGLAPDMWTWTPTSAHTLATAMSLRTSWWWTLCLDHWTTEESGPSNGRVGLLQFWVVVPGTDHLMLRCCDRQRRGKHPNVYSLGLFIRPT